MQFALWQIARGKILTRRELALVLADLKRRAERSANRRFNLVLFRLACCCGLRVSEIAERRLDDIDVTSPRPTIRVRREVGEGGRGRWVPLWWDAGTLADLVAWKAKRLADRGTPTDPFICSQQRRDGAMLVPPYLAAPLHLGLPGARRRLAPSADAPPWAAHLCKQCAFWRPIAGRD